MFARKTCYFFVRPRKSFLEVCFFLGRPVKAPQIKRVENSSKTRLAHLAHVRHRDEVEAPLTDWLREAYELPDRLAAAAAAARAPTKPRSAAKKAGAAGKAKASATDRKRSVKATETRAAAGKRKGARRPRR
jgi:hypothetical protein